MSTIEHPALALTKRRLTAEELHEMKVAAYWFLFLRAPRKSEPESDGSYSLGNISSARLQDQRLQRETPYSICRGVRE